MVATGFRISTDEGSDLLVFLVTSLNGLSSILGDVSNLIKLESLQSKRML